jgi:hypothetical protein
MSNQFSRHRSAVPHRAASLATTLSGLVLVLLAQACGARYEIGELEPPLGDVEPPLGDDSTGAASLAPVLVVDGVEDADAELSDVYWDILPLGDVDGDGFGDWMDFGQLVYGAPRPGEGLPLSSEKGPSFALTGSDEFFAMVGNRRFGLRTVGHGDFNGDGYSDVIVRDPLDLGFVEVLPDHPSPADYEARKQREAEFFRTAVQLPAYLWYGGPERRYGQLVLNDEAVGFRVTEDLTSSFQSVLAGLGDDIEREGTYDVWPAAIGDIDGDGYEDLAVHAYFQWSTSRRTPEAMYGVERLDSGGESITYVYYGRAERFELGVQREPDARLPDVGLTPIGDVNGDGYGDLQAMTAAGSSYLIAGSAKRLPARPTLDAIAVPLLDEDSGIFETSALGDIDGDGFNDFSIGSYLFYGSPSLLQGPVNLNASSAEIVASDQIYELRGAGDWNGDGRSDLLILQEDPMVDVAYPVGLSVIAGTSRRFSGRHEIAPLEPKLDESGSSMGGFAVGADMDGDGRADICFGAGPKPHTWYVKYGGPLTTKIR